MGVAAENGMFRKGQSVTGLDPCAAACVAMTASTEAINVEIIFIA